MKMIIFGNNSEDKFTKINYLSRTLEIPETHDDNQ